MPINGQKDQRRSRYTGAGALFLKKVKLAAAQSETKAKTDAASTLAAAHAQAQTVLEAAHSRAADELGRNVQKVYVRCGSSDDPGSDWFLFDVKTAATDKPPLAETRTYAGLAVDEGAQRIYFVDNEWLVPSLMSSAFDGSDKKTIGSWDSMQIGGSPALDFDEGCAFWIVRDSILRTDISSGQTTQIAVLPNAFAFGPFSGCRIALDTSNRKIYWSTLKELGTFNYDGSNLQYIFRDGRNFFTLSILTVDAKNKCFYGKNDYEVWRSDFDNPSRQWVLPPTAQAGTGNEIGPQYPGVAVDLSTQLIYWLDVPSRHQGRHVIMRSPIQTYDGSSAGREPRQTKEMFVIQQPRPGITDIVLVTTSNAGAQRLADATVRLNYARVSAPRLIAQAHRDGAQHVKDAHAALEAAHRKHDNDITVKQKEADDRRQAAQLEAQAKHWEAGQKIIDANEYDTQTRLKANNDSQSARDKANQDAAAITGPAQAKLDEARSKQQNS